MRAEIGDDRQLNGVLIRYRTMKVCPVCSSVYASTATECRNDGAGLVDLRESGADEPQSSRQRGRRRRPTHTPGTNWENFRDPGREETDVYTGTAPIRRGAIGPAVEPLDEVAITAAEEERRRAVTASSSLPRPPPPATAPVAPSATPAPDVRPGEATRTSHPMAPTATRRPDIRPRAAAIPPSRASKRLAMAVKSPGDTMIGEIIDHRYRVLAILGRGGMGTVYRVEQVHLGRQMALKVLHETLLSERSLVSRFMREARAMSRLSSPHTVRVHDCGQSGSRLYLAMELLIGTSLAKELESGPMPWRRALSILLQMCDSLGEAHRFGVVHRDLKPDNVILLKEGPTPDLVKVFDFGLAKVHGASDPYAVESQMDVFGTPFYMSPEQVLAGTIDHRTDMYAIGAMAFEMLTGQHVFPEHRSTFELLSAHVSLPPPTVTSAFPGGGIPTVVDEIVGSLLEKDPESRIQTMSALSQALTEALGDPPSVAGATRVRTDPGPHGPGTRSYIVSHEEVVVGDFGPEAELDATQIHVPSLADLGNSAPDWADSERQHTSVFADAHPERLTPDGAGLNEVLADPLDQNAGVPIEEVSQIRAGMLREPWKVAVAEEPETADPRGAFDTQAYVGALHPDVQRAIEQRRARAIRESTPIAGEPQMDGPMPGPSGTLVGEHPAIDNAGAPTKAPADTPPPVALEPDDAPVLTAADSADGDTERSPETTSEPLPVALSPTTPRAPIALGPADEPPAIALGPADEPPAIALGPADEPPAIALGAADEPPAIALGAADEPPAIALGLTDEPPATPAEAADEPPVIAVSATHTHSPIEIGGSDELPADADPEAAAPDAADELFIDVSDASFDAANIDDIGAALAAALTSIEAPRDDDLEPVTDVEALADVAEPTEPQQLDEADATDEASVGDEDSSEGPPPLDDFLDLSEQWSDDDEADLGTELLAALGVEPDDEPAVASSGAPRTQVEQPDIRTTGRVPAAPGEPPAEQIGEQRKRDDAPKADLPASGARPTARPIGRGALTHLPSDHIGIGAPPRRTPPRVENRGQNRQAATTHAALGTDARRDAKRSAAGPDRPTRVRETQPVSKSAESPWAKPLPKKKKNDPNSLYWSKVVVGRGRSSKSVHSLVQDDETADPPGTDAAAESSEPERNRPRTALAAALGLAAGTTIGGNYEVIARAGAGNVGVVYRARDRHTGHDVAIKLLHPHISAAPDAEARLAEIARNATLIDNPAAETISEVGRHGESLYCVSAWMNGRTLEAVMAEQRRIKLPVVGRVVGKALNALQAAHDVGVLHGDLQAHNIFIIEKPAEPHFLRLVDFEQASLATLGEPDAALQVHPSGVTPEQLAGGAPSPESEFYGLGWLIYTMLAGQPPYTAAGATIGDRTSALRAAMREPPPAVTELAHETLLPGLVALIDVLLAPDPRNRPANVAEVRDLLRRAGRGEPVAVAPRDHIATLSNGRPARD